ncbi:ferredoxin-NADP+ reductase subunit alpha [Vallitalea longa]|uniref:Ferredoxin-NADP+ reductase subunit alpha n=1 Tax=Vallitalea longa TaxID=2936439 RepID=A0A9W5YC68_9FIRM|nr:sulfide/dihydroorotate dehydrogenase-like FAD/NAD-binding protein [Vallitalea longa]GKX29915.1 ferredoxin-NADP+ reductase subunit alpha [Vallitalea longa]
MYKIVTKRKLNDLVELMEIEAPFVSRKCEPGQFIILRVDEEGERIPLTIADYDREKDTVTIIYQVVGYTTKKLSLKNEGDYIEDFVGPLGQEAPLHKVKRVLGIGGGVGIAPLYPQLKKMKELGVEVDAILGGRSDEFIILDTEMENTCDNVYYATNDGSKGIKGFVTDKLNELIENGEKYDLVIAIGPLIMMKTVCEITKKLGIKTNVSLNPIMIDGTGMCGGCRVTVGGETKFACVDGPDFDGHEVDFDEAMRRQGMYKEEEKDHVCRLGLED